MSNTPLKCQIKQTLSCASTNLDMAPIQHTLMRADMA